AVGNFWATLARGDLPEPTDRDATALKRLYSKPTTGKFLLADSATYEAALYLEDTRQKVREAKELAAIAEGKLLRLIRDADTVQLGDGRILTARLQHRAAYQVQVAATDYRVIKFQKARP